MKAEQYYRRNSSVELLRILSMMGVIFLHYQNATIGGAIAIAAKGSVNYEVILCLKTFALCAVNIFVLITGYYSFDRQTISWKKVLELIVQTIVISDAMYVLSVFLKISPFRLKELLLNSLPTNWFVILYLTLYICSTYLNRICAEMKEKQSARFLLMAFLLFSVWPNVVDILQEIFGREFRGLSSIGIEGSQNGYTIVNFGLLYLIGSFLGRYQIPDRLKNSNLILCFLVSAGTIFAWQHINTRTATEYCNPVLILESCVILCLFVRMHFYHRAINSLAKASFTVYLTHIALLRRAQIDRFVNGSTPIFLLHIFCTVVIIYAVGYGIWVIWSQIWNRLYDLISGQKKEKQ